MIIYYSRCPQYYNLPAYCHYEQDPSDTCCRKPKCDPSQTVQPRTTPSIYNNLGPTIAPNKPKPTGNYFEEFRFHIDFFCI